MLGWGWLLGDQVMRLAELGRAHLSAARLAQRKGFPQARIILNSRSEERCVERTGGRKQYFVVKQRPATYFFQEPTFRKLLLIYTTLLIESPSQPRFPLATDRWLTRVNTWDEEK